MLIRGKSFFPGKATVKLNLRVIWLFYAAKEAGKERFRSADRLQCSTRNIWAFAAQMLPEVCSQGRRRLGFGQETDQVVPLQRCLSTAASDT